LARPAESRRVDQALVTALGHPVRVEILEVLNEREASPRQLEDILGQPLGNLSYHTKVLLECGCVELVRTAQRRGALEHFFRAVPRSFVGHQDLRKVPRSLRTNVTAMSLQSFIDAAVAAIKAGKIDDREDTILNWMVIGVDELGRAQALDVARAALKQLEAIHDQSRERAAASEKPLTPMVVGLAGFEAAAQTRTKVE
jgi:DNA-binding transcriptional ArsR family regulator